MATLVDGTLTVTTAGTEVAFHATPSTMVQWIRIHAKVGMTGALVVGASTVVAAASGRRGVVVPEPGADGANAIHPLVIVGPFDLSTLYLDSTVDGEIVHYVYLTYP